MRRIVFYLMVASAAALFTPRAAHAQVAIAGVVRDGTGAVLPGVTVEASSPALIERTRTVVTDTAGQYKIVELRPGTYTVTFTLPGFSTVKREGIELTSDFTAQVSVELKVGQKTLSAFARVGAGPPTFAPDGLPIRTVADELEQALLGPVVDPSEATLEKVEEILRRGLETVRLMNTAVMNGNTINGRVAVASMMPSQDSNDTSRLFAPIMAPTLVDNLALVALHQGIFAALRSGSRPWFLDVLRLPEEIGDLSDKGRRKMPAMMRGADGRYLTLTRRQIDMIRKAAEQGPFGERKT